MINCCRSEKNSNEQIIDPWKVKIKKGYGIDYSKIIKEWGCSKITHSFFNLWEKIVGLPLHPLIRRGIYYSHRDLHLILQCYVRKEPFYLYTGRGPSSKSMHLGHMIPFIINKYLQDIFKVPMIIQITNDEKFFWKNLTWEETYNLGKENIKDILAFGFDVSKTFIFMDNDYFKQLYPNISKIQKKIKYKKLCKIFGFKTNRINIGKILYPSVQCAPAFSSTFPILFRGIKMRCLVPCAIDQDPYFRLTRDIAPLLGEFKTSTIYAKFIPALSGLSKMNASDSKYTIYLNDSPLIIEKKIKQSFSGGKKTIKKHRLLGANVNIDVACQYLMFFMDNDDELSLIKKKYTKGQLLSSEIKRRLTEILIPKILQIQDNRRNITQFMIKNSMKLRPLVILN